MGNGIILTVVRMLDPIYRQMFWEQFIKNFGMVSIESEDKSKPLSQILAQSLNLELINIILQGILKFADPDYKTMLMS